MIGNQMFDEQDLADYQEKMKGRRIFVSNLSFETQWKYLKEFMRKIGDVVRVDIFQDDKGRSKGCGVVEFAHKEDCSRAIQELD